MLTTTALAAAVGCALAHPIMVLPPGLRADAEVFEVTGLRGLHPWNHDIRFGPFRTRSTRAGWTGSDSISWGILDDNYASDTKSPVTFVLEGGECPRSTARCMGRSRRVHRAKAVGITSTEDGIAIDRQVVEDVSSSSFDCDFDAGGPAAGRLLLSNADESGFGGVLIDDRGATVARVRATNRQTGVPYTYAIPFPVGFLVETTAGEIGAVERAFQGKVIIGHAARARDRCAFVTVAAALLLWDPLP